MAANGLINGYPGDPDRTQQSSTSQSELDAGQLFAQWLQLNPNATPQEIFAAGLNTGLSGGTLPPPVVHEGMGFPTGAEEFIPPASGSVADDFTSMYPEAQPIPGIGEDTEWGGRTKTPYDNFPTGEGFRVYDKGIPGQTMSPDDFHIDMNEFGIPPGQRPRG